MFGEGARSFLKEFGKRVKMSPGDPMAKHLLQRISVAVQRGNAAAVLRSTGLRDEG